MDSNTPSPRDTIRDVVGKLSIQQHLQIMDEHDQYEKTGTIGDSLLRTTAESLGATSFNGMIAFTMHAVAFETYRHIAKCQRRNYANYAWAMN